MDRRPRHLIALTTLVALAACAAPRTSEPDPALSGSPPEVVAIWAREGPTERDGTGAATYFNDRAAPTLPAGGIAVGWACTGATSLMLEISIVEGPGPASIPPPARGLSAQLPCPTVTIGDQLTWIRLAGQAIGGENVLVVRPAVVPAPPIDFSVIVAHVVE
jgi:hypothetical protein